MTAVQGTHRTDGTHHHFVAAHFCTLPYGKQRCFDEHADVSRACVCLHVEQRVVVCFELAAFPPFFAAVLCRRHLFSRLSVDIPLFLPLTHPPLSPLLQLSSF